MGVQKLADRQVKLDERITVENIFRNPAKEPCSPNNAGNAERELETQIPSRGQSSAEKGKLRRKSGAQSHHAPMGQERIPAVEEPFFMVHRPAPEYYRYGNQCEHPKNEEPSPTSPVFNQ